MKNTKRTKINREFVLLIEQRKFLRILIVGIIILTSLMFYQSFSATDSIIEIRFTNDFFIDAENIEIYDGFNTSDFTEYNTTLDKILDVHGNDHFSIIELTIWFVDKESEFSLLTKLEKVAFIERGNAFENFDDLKEETAEDKGFFIKSISIINSNKTIQAGLNYTFRVPRGYVFYGIQGFFGNQLSYYEDSTIYFVDQFIYAENFFGYANNTLSESITDYRKTIIEFHSLKMSQEAKEFREDHTESGYELWDQNLVAFSDFPSETLYYMNISVSKGKLFEDIFNPSIK